jgi:hypothetical protein
MIDLEGYKRYFENIAGLHPDVINAIHAQPSAGIPIGGSLHIMDHGYIERIAGVEKGEYSKAPDKVYVDCLKNAGMNVLDQYLAHNPLEMGDRGYENREAGPTTGNKTVVVDGMTIDSPEAVAYHLESIVFPALQASIDTFPVIAYGNAEILFDTIHENKIVNEHVVNTIEHEYNVQKDMLGNEILKMRHGSPIPTLFYTVYGYENYFMAYALYPEIMEKHFKLQAEYCSRINRIDALLYKLAGLPPFYRIDHDIADGRGTLADIKSLEKIYFPYIKYALEPLAREDIRLIWHCDGNLMNALPRLLDAGITGFQGFQYEYGMDYEKICKMKTSEGRGLVIWGGVSVTTTLPFGSPQDIKDEMAWLVEKGPKEGLFLDLSSSLTPGVPWGNVETLIEGFKYYKTKGRRAS